MRTIFKAIIVQILNAEARIVLAKYKPKIVGVTGSVGKTTTKEAIYTVLCSTYYARKNPKSYNAELGVPLTILGLENAWGSPLRWLKNIIEGVLLIILPNHYPKWLVIELGADRPGDIKRMVSWVKLDVAVITAIGDRPVHVEFFPSVESLIKEKLSIVNGLKRGGALVLNYDDENVLGLKQKTQFNTYTYGKGDGAEIKLSNLKVVYDAQKNPSGTTFKVSLEGNVLPVTLPRVLGIQHAYPIAAAIAVAEALGINLVTAIESFRSHTFTPGRMAILKGVRRSTIIDDSYNASPIATEAALNVLTNIETSGRKIAVLGQMTELGELTEQAHKEASVVAKASSDVVITIGDMYEKFKGDTHFASSEAAADFVRDTIRDRDVILVKGSQSVRMEKIVAAIMEERINKKFLLVRQEKEWLARP